MEKMWGIWGVNSALRPMEERQPGSARLWEQKNDYPLWLQDEDNIGYIQIPTRKDRAFGKHIDRRSLTALGWANAFLNASKMYWDDEAPFHEEFRLPSSEKPISEQRAPFIFVPLCFSDQRTQKRCRKLTAKAWIINNHLTILTKLI